MMGKAITNCRLLLACLLLLAASCSNPCKEIECKNNGTCREGACACPNGFEGTFCEHKMSDKFIGFYEGTVRSNGEKDMPMTLIVTPVDGNPKKVNFYYLDVLGSQNIITADVTGVNMAIPQQTITSNNFKYRGSGYLEVDKYIHIWYEETDKLGVLRNCIFEGTKKIKP
jgi:hypothetical protein